MQEGDLFAQTRALLVQNLVADLQFRLEPVHLVAKRGQQRGKLFALRLLHVGLLHAQGFGRQQPELAGHFLAQLAQRRNLARGGFVILLRRQPGFGQLRAHLRDLLPGLVQRVGQPVAFLRQFAQARPLRLGTDLVLADLQFQRVNPAIGVLQSGLQRRLACPARRQGATQAQRQDDQHQQSDGKQGQQGLDGLEIAGPCDDPGGKILRHEGSDCCASGLVFTFCAATQPIRAPLSGHRCQASTDCRNDITAAA